MKKLTLFAAGAWTLGLLTGLYAWLSPDSALFPGIFLGLGLVAAALVLLTAGVVYAGIKGGTPRASFVAAFAALAPLVGAAIGLTLAARGLLPHPALPLLFIVASGLGVQRWTRTSPEVEMTWVGDVGLAVILVASLFLVLPALLLGAGGQIIWAIATPSFGNIVARVKVTNVLVAQRLAPHSGITATTAGLALQAIANTGTPRRESLLIDVPGSSPRPWIPDSEPFGAWSGDSLMRHARSGLTKGERAWLQQLGSHPGLPLLDTVTFAVALDPWAALKTPLPRDLNAFSLPIPSMKPIRDAARMQLYRAALAVADRKPAVADSLTRAVITFGLRLRDDSDLLIGTIIGNTIAREGGLALAALWRAGGKAAEADALVMALQLPPRVVDTSMAEDGSSPRALRAALIRGATDGANGRAIRFEHLVVLGMTSCADLRELLYGPTPAAAAAFAATAPLFQRSPKEQEVFARMSFGIASSQGMGELAPVFRPAAMAFGRRPVAACAQTMFGVGLH